MRNVYSILAGEPKGKRQLKDLDINGWIMMTLILMTEQEGVDCSFLDQDRYRWHFLTSWPTVSFSRSTFLKCVCSNPSFDVLWLKLTHYQPWDIITIINFDVCEDICFIMLPVCCYLLHIYAYNMASFGLMGPLLHSQLLKLPSVVDSSLVRWASKRAGQFSHCTFT